ncbi:MAG: LuxR C-terminal-related transcriptional regulator [Acidithiobacillus sp.]
MKIAESPRISERTVNFHIRNAMAKPNAGNKTDAVLRSAMLGCYRSRWTPIFLPPCVLRHRLFGELIPQNEDALN